MSSLSIEQLKNIIHPFKYKDEILYKILDSLEEVFTKYQINTKLRQNHFLAQVLHESMCFKYNEEIASGDAYDTRVDLGNTPEKDGDGRLFKGRGWIQCTGKTNYLQASREFKVDFIKNPDLMEEYPYCALVAGWYWDRKNLNMFADKDDIKSITKRINGGYNGLDDRISKYNKCKQFNN